MDEAESNKIDQVQTANQEDPTPQVGSNTSSSKPKKLKVLLLIAGACVVVIAVLVGVLFFRQGQNPIPDEASSALESAKASSQRGALELSRKALEEALAEAPDNAELLTSVITTIANEGSLSGTEGEAFAKGQPYVQKALDLHSQNAEVLIAVGFLYEVSGRYEEALDFYEKGLSIDPDNANGYFHKGHVLEFLGRTEESNNAYLKSYELDKANPYTLMALGKMALTQGKTEDAVSFYKTAAALDSVPDHVKAEALSNASIIRRNQMLYMEEAINLSEQAVDIYPSFSPALATHGFNLGINGNIEEGVEFMKKAIEINPRISQNYWYLGMLLRSVKVYDEALQYQLEGYKVIEMDNTLLGLNQRAKVKAGMAYDLAKTTYLSGENDGVLEYLSTALELDPELKNQLKSDVDEYNQFARLRNSSQMQGLLE